MLCLFLFFYSSAQKNKKNRLVYQGFSGGMLLHTGYVWSNTFEVSDGDGRIRDYIRSGFPFGIGGKIHFLFGKHLRFGGEGYSTNLHFKDKSYCATGWGGLLIDCIWQKKVVSPYVGFTFGGGSQKTLVLPDNFNDQNNTSDIYFHKFGFLALVPFCGMEIKATQKIKVNIKVDYLLNLSNWQKDFVTGPRLYIGVLFTTLSKKSLSAGL
jgi:hypothetical protein